MRKWASRLKSVERVVFSRSDLAETIMRLRSSGAPSPKYTSLPMSPVTPHSAVGVRAVTSSPAPVWELNAGPSGSGRSSMLSLTRSVSDSR
jgi:hypothetical protein